MAPTYIGSNNEFHMSSVIVLSLQKHSIISNYFYRPYNLLKISIACIKFWVKSFSTLENVSSSVNVSMINKSRLGIIE